MATLMWQMHSKLVGGQLAPCCNAHPTHPCQRWRAACRWRGTPSTKRPPLLSSWVRWKAGCGAVLCLLPHAAGCSLAKSAGLQKIRRAADPSP